MARRIIPFFLIILTAALYSGTGAAGAADKKQEIADRLFEIELMGGDHLGYCAEILDHLDRVYNIRPSKYESYQLEYNDRRDFARDNMDLYSIMSGGLDIRESLQLDTIKTPDNDKRSIDPVKLRQPDVKSHPFNDMLRGREYKTFPLDKCTPFDFYSVHFANLARGLDFFDYVEKTGGDVHRRFTMRSADFNIREKIMTQLALKDGKDARAFYNSAISETVITGSDPFIIEGSDVTLVLRVKVPALFKTTIASYRNSFRDSWRAERKSVTIEGVVGEYIFTPDRRINSVMLELPDGTVIISNSVGAAGIVAATALGKRRCLADEPDYKYMRSLCADSADPGSGFFYLSDAFIRRLVSPDVRIREARRMKEAMRMALLEKYVIFYYMLNGAYPSSLEDVLTVMGMPPLSDTVKRELQAIRKNRFHETAVKLPAETLQNWDTFRCAITPKEEEPQKGKASKAKKKKKSSGPDDYIVLMKKFYGDVTGDKPESPADVYELMADLEKPGGHMADRFARLTVSRGSFTVCSTEYGRAGLMVPNIEKELGQVTPGEASEYARFVADYNSSRREYTGPIAASLSLGEGGITVDAYMLPPADSSMYNSLVALTGRGEGELHPDDTVEGDMFSFCMKVNPDDYRIVELFRTGFGSRYRFSDIFGSELQVHMGDSLPVTDFDGNFLFEEYMNHGFDRSDAFSGLLMWSVFHPVRIAIPVKKAEQALAMLDGFDPGSIVNRTYMQSERYSFEYRGTQVRALKMTVFYTMTFRIYYFVRDGMLHVATTEKYIRSVLDMPVKNDRNVKANAVLVFRPAAMTQGRESYSAGIIESALESSRRNAGTIKLLSMIYPGANGRDLPGLAYRDFGFMPVCALGGEYSIDRSTGDVQNSVYGSWALPVLKPENGRSGIYDSLKRLFGTREIRIELEFTPQVLRTRIKTLPLPGR